MAIIKGLRLPKDENHMSYPYPTQVLLEDCNDVELVPFSHTGKCDGHWLAVGVDSQDYFRDLPCDKTDLFVATKYFTKSDLPEGFSGVISYVSGCKPSADVLDVVATNMNEVTNASADIFVRTSTYSPSFGALLTVAAVGLVGTKTALNKLKSMVNFEAAKGKSVSKSEIIKKHVSRKMSKIAGNNGKYDVSKMAVLNYLTASQHC